MGRPRKPVNEAKKPVTISLAPPHIVILDNLAKQAKITRSAVIQEMLKEKGWSDLKLKETVQHTTAKQNWPAHNNQTQRLGFVMDPDGPTACNPYHMDGQCQHDHCQMVYLKYGVI